MKLSVVIPAYNRADYIGRTLESLAAQTRRADEVLVIDDGSTDETATVVAGFSEVQYYRQENAGLGAARNAGMARVTGEALLFLDSDDLLVPGALAALEAALIANNDAIFAYSRAALIDPDDSVLEALWEIDDAEGWIWERLIRGNFIRSPGCVLIRRSALEKAAPWTTDTAMGGHEDWDLWLRLAEQGPVVRIPEPLFLYRVHPGGMSQNNLKMHRTAHAVLKSQERRWRGDATKLKAIVETLQVCARGTAHLLCEEARVAWENGDDTAAIDALRLAMHYDREVWKQIGPMTNSPLRLRHVVLYPLTKSLPKPPPPQAVDLEPRPLTTLSREPAAPRVSVVIPAYGHRDFITRALESVYAQTFTDFEVIVVNDGSPDDTEAVLQPWIVSEKIRYVAQANAGQGAARNRGIAMARGEFIALLDDDDLFPTDKLARQVALLEANPEAALAYGPSQPIGNDDQPIEPCDWYGEPLPWPWEGPTGNVWAAMVTRNWLVTPGQALIRRAALAAIEPLGFDPDPAIKGCDDWDLMLRLSEAYPFVFDPQVTLRYRFHPSNASQNTLKMRQSALALYDKHRRRHKAHPARRILLDHWRMLFAQHTPTYLLKQALQDRAAGDVSASLRKLNYILRSQPKILLTDQHWKFYLVTLLRASDPRVAAKRDQEWAEQQRRTQRG